MKKLNLSMQIFAPAIEWVEARTKLQRILIYALAIVLLVGGFTYFAYLPKHKEIVKLESEYKKLAQKLDRAKKTAKQLNFYRSKMKAAEAQFNIVMKALPEKEEIPSLLNGISQAARDAGLDITKFQPNPEIAKDFYAEVPITINVDGNYHNVAMFFDKISKLPRIVTIGALKLLPDKEGDTLSTSCTAVTYKFIEPVEKTPPGKKKKK
ncbi:MAG: type 4a pilus biogenesis protein PilO [Deltaproteobacteria bacterium]|jgi:type IV pilus assembly protein PilO|nr:type 4a pilus biogenesis protein PilO [Deltaproteobacteria bacterium]